MSTTSDSTPTPTPRFEKPTDELRQVRHRESHQVYYLTQRRFEVQNGEPFYSPEEPYYGDPDARGLKAVKIGEWHPLKPHYGFRWMPVKNEWRTIPVISAEEAAKQ